MADATGQARKLRQGLARLIDGYAEGLLEKAEFEPRLARLRERIARLEAEAAPGRRGALQRELTLVIGRVEAFAGAWRRPRGGGLAQRREILQALVKRVEVDRGQATVVFRIDPGRAGRLTPEPLARSWGASRRPSLQGDVPHPQALQPVAQGHGSPVIVPKVRTNHAALVVLRQQHARHDSPLVHVQATAPRVGRRMPALLPAWSACGRGGAEHSQLSVPLRLTGQGVQVRRHLGGRRGPATASARSPA